MPNISVAIPHDASVDEIKSVVDESLDKLIKNFEGKNPSKNWDGSKCEYSFSSLGFSIKGDVDVKDKEIVVSVQLPFAAMIFKDKVEKAIKKQMALIESK